MKKIKRDELKRAYDEQISKANESVIMANQPGKHAPRWFAAYRNLDSALQIAQRLDWKHKPTDIGQAMADSISRAYDVKLPNEPMEQITE